MAQLAGQRHVRLYGPAFSLWDVRDVEAHCRVLLDSTLRGRSARLDAAKYDDALAYLVALCWRLSGLQEDGKTLRHEWATEILITSAGTGEASAATLGPYTSRERAEASYAAWSDRQELGDAIAVGEHVEVRPRGAYDRGRGLSFSTYSRRILSRRVWDWYRATFGDNRYGDVPKPLSLDQLVDEWENHRDGSGADESYLDRSGPGARLDFVDELNRHAYHDPTEEVLTRAAISG